MILKTRRWKQARWWSRVKLIYSRITLNRFTIWYFLFALLNCLVLVVLQGIAFADNSKVSSAVHNITRGFSVDYASVLHGTGMCPPWICTKSPSNGRDDKRSILDLDGMSKIQNRGFGNSKDDDNEDFWHPDRPPTENDDTTSSKKLGVPKCEILIFMFDYTLSRETREEIVIMVFDIWLLSLGFVTIVNESLPHLGASLVGHVLGTGWAAYHLASHGHLQNLEASVIKHCGPHSWSISRVHDNHIVIFVFNLVALVALAFLSFKLFKVYASQSFSRIGSSATVSKVYKIVLVFSACLQLAAFFSLASASIWLDLVAVIQHWRKGEQLQLYFVAFILIILLSLPWLYLGWVSVRKEGRRRFLVFSHISVFLVILSSLMFFSDLYQFSFKTWPFFAVTTVTAFVLIVSTTVLGVWSRMNFGRGLSQYLEATDALDEINFTPETFRNESEKGNAYRGNGDHIDGKQILQMIAEYIKQPQVAHQPTSKRRRGQSIYSEKSGIPLKLSSTPSLIQERDWAATGERSSVHRINTFSRDHLKPRSDGYQQIQTSTTSAGVSSKKSRDLIPSRHSSFASPMSPSMYLPPRGLSILRSESRPPQASERLVKEGYTGEGPAF